MRSEAQNSLPGIAVADHSGLGADWEREISATNQWYALQKWADVRKVPHNWTFISEKEYRKMQAKLPASFLAQTDDGKFMQRMKSDVDFTGGGVLGGKRFTFDSVDGGKRFSVCFDAKQTKGDRFPLQNVEEHQIRKLKDRSRCGWVSGLLVRFSDRNRAFFVSADLLDSRYDQMLALKRGNRAKPGTARSPSKTSRNFALRSSATGRICSGIGCPSFQFSSKILQKIFQKC